MVTQREIDNCRVKYKRYSRDELISVVYSTLEDCAEHIAAKQTLQAWDKLMVCPGCGSKISSSSNSCAHCKRVFTSEFGRVPRFPGLVIEWIECPWCGKPLKVSGQMDVGGDTTRQHCERRRETLDRHRNSCPYSDKYGERCARCGTGINIVSQDVLKYHKGRVYGSCCLPIVRSE